MIREDEILSAKFSAEEILDEFHRLCEEEETALST
jgi:hypothetical protein